MAVDLGMAEVNVVDRVWSISVSRRPPLLVACISLPHDYINALFEAAVPKNSSL